MSIRAAWGCGRFSVKADGIAAVKKIMLEFEDERKKDTHESIIQAVIIWSEEGSGVHEKNCSCLSMSFRAMRKEAQASERLEGWISNE